MFYVQASSVQPSRRSRDLVHRLEMLHKLDISETHKIQQIGRKIMSNNTLSELPTTWCKPLSR